MFDTAFIGYAKNTTTYRFLVIKSKNGLVEVNSIIKTKNVNFFENIFFLEDKWPTRSSKKS